MMYFFVCLLQVRVETVTTWFIPMRSTGMWRKGTPQLSFAQCADTSHKPSKSPQSLRKSLQLADHCHFFFVMVIGQRAQNQDFYYTKLFIYRYNCQVHVMGSHGPDMQIKCPECSVVCRNPHSLKCHINHKHKDRKRLYMIRS